ncbi:MAG: hypothetical protein M1482_04405 [Chloroflexi bacterium]|nr:hypothetical protein [Chloroflexota bacterium]
MAKKAFLSVPFVAGAAKKRARSAKVSRKSHPTLSRAGGGMAASGRCCSQDLPSLHGWRYAGFATDRFSATPPLQTRPILVTYRIISAKAQKRHCAKILARLDCAAGTKLTVPAGWRDGLDARQTRNRITRLTVSAIVVITSFGFAGCDRSETSKVEPLAPKVAFMIPDGSITTAKLAKSASDSDRIADKAVTAPKLADGVVSSVKLAANAVTGEKVADNAITSDKIASGQISAKQLVPDFMLSEAFVADAAMTTNKVHDGAIATAKLADGSVTNPKLAPDAVTSDKIKNGEVTTEGIKDGTIAAIDLGNGQVTSDKLNENVAGGGLELAKDAANAGTALNVLVDGSTIKIAGKASGNKLYVPKDGVTSDEIKDYTIVSDDVIGQAVTTAKLADEVAGDGLVFDRSNDGSLGQASTGDLRVNTGDGLKISGDKVVVNAGSGLATDTATGKLLIPASGVTNGMLEGGIEAAKLVFGNGLDSNDGGGLTVVAARNGGLTVGSGGVGITPGGVTNDMLEGAISAVKLAGSIGGDKLVLGNGLGLDESKGLAVVVDGSGGLAVGAGGVGIKPGGITDGMLAGLITSVKLAGGISADQLDIGDGLASSAGKLQVDGSYITGIVNGILNDKLNWKSLPAGVIPSQTVDFLSAELDAGQITSGTIDTARLPNGAMPAVYSGVGVLTDQGVGYATGALSLGSAYKPGVKVTVTSVGADGANLGSVAVVSVNPDGTADIKAKILGVLTGSTVDVNWIAMQ